MWRYQRVQFKLHYDTPFPPSLRLLSQTGQEFLHDNTLVSDVQVPSTQVRDKIISLGCIYPDPRRRHLENTCNW